MYMLPDNYENSYGSNAGETESKQSPETTSPLLSKYENYEVSKLMELASQYVDPSMQSKLLFALNKTPATNKEVREQANLIFELYKQIIDANHDIVSSSFTKQILDKASSNFNFTSLSQDLEENHDYHMELIHYNLGEDKVIVSEQEKTQQRLAEFFGEENVKKVLDKTKPGEG